MYVEMEYTSVSMGHTYVYVDGWMDGRMDGWTDGRMDGWTDGRMELEKERERYIYIYIYRAEREGETTLNYVYSETTRAGNTAGDEGCDRICFAWLASLGRI